MNVLLRCSFPKAAFGNDDVHSDLRAAATKVIEALNSLSQQVKEGVHVGQNDETADAIPAATERLFRLGGHPQPITQHSLTHPFHFHTPLTTYAHTSTLTAPWVMVRRW